jgi:hypothetical protein
VTKPPPITSEELIRWAYVERSGRKGYLDRDFYVSDIKYRWLSSRVTPEGLVRMGIREPVDISRRT